MPHTAAAPPSLPYDGNLVESLVATVIEAEAEGKDGDPTSTSPEASTAEEGQAKARRGPALVHKQDGRNYFRLTEIPGDTSLPCATADCNATARLLADSRDCEVLAYCVMCANVEHAMWLAGVRV